MERPQSVYKTLYQQQGLRFEQGADRLTVEGALTPGEYELAGNVSSQFISGLLFALPLGVTGIWLSVPIDWALADAIGIGYYLKKSACKNDEAMVR